MNKSLFFPHKAIVEDTNDPLKKGRIQVRLIPEMENAIKSHLPWYDPFFGTGNNSCSIYRPPKNGSIIIVFSSNSIKRSGYYLSQDHIEGFFDYTTIQSLLSSILELSDSTYDKIHFELLENGNLHFNNKETGEEGFLHKNGTYVFFDSNGKIIINSQDAIEHKALKNIIINSSQNIDMDATQNITINGLSIDLNSGVNGAARLNDTTISNIALDSVFWTWVINITAAINSLLPGSVPIVPGTLNSQINSGSTSVKIG